MSQFSILLKATLPFLMTMSITYVHAQEKLYKETHKIYSGKGKEVGYYAMLERLKEADVVLFGELHNNTLVHWLQLSVISDLHAQNRPLTLGAEMYSTDQQMDIDEFLSKIQDDESFENNTKQWPNYKIDYKPVLQFARDQSIPFYACNAPRTLSLIAARKGLDTINAINSDSIRSLLAPLPLEVDFSAPGYKELMEEDFGSTHGMSTEKMVVAQALKDATMAHNIASNLEDGKTFIHLNGDFHSKGFGGIYWYLKKTNKKLDVITISSVEAAYCSFPEEAKKAADFVISLSPDIPKSY